MKQNTLQKFCRLNHSPFFLLFFSAMFLIAGCGPPPPEGKVEYLRQFSALAEYANKNCSQLSDGKFETLDAIFELFSHDWYRKFYGELSRQEIATVWGYRLQYLKCKAKRKARKKGELLYLKLEGQLLDQE
ncbi:MAG: hypothetical protein J5I94_12015 [Phaeodactylibacter sp.]|nr:hypothetical protein [Phaeodactylibacter sp.]